MKIAAIRTIAAVLPLRSALCQRRRRAGAARRRCWSRSRPMSGIIGIGEAGLGGGVTATVIDKDLAPLLIGEDPLLIEGLWQKMFARTRQYGRRGVVDARDQRHRHRAVGHRRQGRQTAGLPPARRLPRPGRGLCQRRLLPGRQGDRRLAGEAEGYRARGFKGMKMKIGRNPSTQTHLRQLLGQAEFCEVDPAEDIARVAAVRKALGPQAKLMVDVNCAWSPAFAIEMGRAMEPYNLYWIEEPVATDDIDGSAAVADALAHPDRRLRDRGRALRLPRADRPRRGRYRAARHRLVGRVLANAAASPPMPRRITGWSRRTPLPARCLVASLHFAASIPNALVLEWDQNPNAIRDELLKEPLQPRKRRHGQTARTARPRHRARPRRGRALPGRVTYNEPH